MECGGAIIAPSTQQSPPLTLKRKSHHHGTNSLTLSLINKCSDVKHVHQLHACLIKTNNAHNNFYVSKLLSLFIQTDQLHQACLLFSHAKRPNTLIWNTLIKAHVDKGLFLEALILYKTMNRKGMRPDSYTFPFVLKACSALSAITVGIAVHPLVIKCGFEANAHVQNSVVDMYCKCLCIESARKVFDEMPERDLVSWTAIVSGYARVGDVDSAELLFGLMPEKDVVSWGAIISSFAQNDCADEVLVFFHEMQLCGVWPGEVAIVSALSACASLGLRSIGIWLHGFVIRHGFKLSVFMGTALVDMYSKCGDINNACQVFNSMHTRSLASWNSIIGGLAMNGCAEEALLMFSKMEEVGIEPNSITLSSVLSACRHGGLVEEGSYYFEYFSKEHEISPNIEHYGCMVDLLGRAGYLNEAYELIKCMPFESNEVVWGALLGACKIYGDIELGEYALEQLVVLDPKNRGNYVLLSNMYAMLGRWEDVERVRAAMRDVGAEKARGSSAIEVNSVVHEFYAGDQTHPDVLKVYEKLEELYCKMDVLGYLPATDSHFYNSEIY